MAGALVLGIAWQGWSISAAEYDVTRHGMDGDGVTLNTLALQTLIDHCVTEGGGTLHFPAGDYLTHREVACGVLCIRGREEDCKYRPLPRRFPAESPALSERPAVTSVLWSATDWHRFASTWQLTCH